MALSTYQFVAYELILMIDQDFEFDKLAEVSETIRIIYFTVET